MRIKGALADNNGTTYFENELKEELRGAAMKGTLVEGKPACKSKSCWWRFRYRRISKDCGRRNYLETGYTASRQARDRRDYSSGPGSPRHSPRTPSC